MTFVLKSKPYLPWDRFGDGYYTGETYFFQKERYAVCEKELDKAKHYKNFKVAKNACEKMLVKCCNYVFAVVAVENGKEIGVWYE